MTSDEWLMAGVALAAGFLIGMILGWLARRMLTSSRVREEFRAVAKPTGIFLFWFSVAVGAGVAMTIVSPGSLDSLPSQILEYMPRILAAGLILLAGYALAVALGQLASRTLGAASGSHRRGVGTVTRVLVMSAAVVLALAQLGVDVTILTILVAAIAFGAAAAFALLIGLGGRDVAAALAAGRYVRRHVEVGWTVELNGETGTVVALHQATIEMETNDGRRLHHPYTTVLEAGAVLQPPTDS